MALISVAVYDTIENRRSTVTARFLGQLAKTVDWDKHRLFLIDNNSCDDTKRILEDFRRHTLPYTLISNDRNVGTARAINMGWVERREGENCVKMDNDILVYEYGWLDRLEDCIARDPKIGIIGLKRKDLDENPNAPTRTWSHSKLHMLSHDKKKNQRWLIVEQVEHVIGSCQLYNSTLLDKMGFLVQFGRYGLDDCIACARSKVAGFYNAFYPHYEIDHIDPGGTQYHEDNRVYAGERMRKFDMIRGQYMTAARPIYHGPTEDLDEEIK